VPIVPDGRPTRRGAKLNGGELVHELAPSYHGRPGQAAADLLVFHEFGLDLVDRLDALGFRTEVVQDPANPTLITLMSRSTIG
jgi:hypothetical protein